MSIQTVVVVIIVLIVLVVVIAFAVPQLTGIFGGLAQVSNSTASNIDTNIDLAPKACYQKSQNTPGSNGCSIDDTTACPRNCEGKCSIANQNDCLLQTNGSIGYLCCKWTKVN